MALGDRHAHARLALDGYRGPLAPVGGVAEDLSPSERVSRPVWTRRGPASPSPIRALLDSPLVRPSEPIPEISMDSVALTRIGPPRYWHRTRSVSVPPPGGGSEMSPAFETGPHAGEGRSGILASLGFSTCGSCIRGPMMALGDIAT